MSFEKIIETIKNLNEEWYNSKKSFFILEPCYDERLNKIIIKGEPQHWEHEDEETGEYKDGLYYPDMIEYPLSQYCWISKFEGCLAFSNIEIIGDVPSEIHNLPVDGVEVCESLMKYYKKFFKTITDHSWIAKEIIDNLKAIEYAFSIKKDYSDYDKAKYYILKKYKECILAEYGSHVTLYNKHSNKSIYRTLSIDVCNRIAEFRLNNKCFITSVDGDITKGAALHNLFSYEMQPNSNIKLYVDDWQKKDVYYLLMKLFELVTDTFNIQEIERKQMLTLKGTQPFKSSAYSIFKSGKYESHYINDKNKAIIDSQVEALFK